jgi:hypothetical protein
MAWPPETACHGQWGDPRRATRERIGERGEIRHRRRLAAVERILNGPAPSAGQEIDEIRDVARGDAETERRTLDRSPVEERALVETDATVVISLMVRCAGGVAPSTARNASTGLSPPLLLTKGRRLGRSDKGSRPVQASHPCRAQSSRRPPFSLAPVVWARRRSRPITSRPSPRPARPRVEPARRCDGSVRRAACQAEQSKDPERQGAPRQPLLLVSVHVIPLPRATISTQSDP